jgi:hypothetical protein
MLGVETTSSSSFTYIEAAQIWVSLSQYLEDKLTTKVELNVILSYRSKYVEYGG